jgi:TP901 family phage tail tape measure protein
MSTLGDLMLRVGADLSTFNAAMGTMSDKLKAAEREAVSLWSGFEALGSRMTAVGTTLSTAVTLPIVGIGAASAQAFGQFESSLNRVSALGEITGKDLDKLKAQAIDLGAKTQFSAKQAADGMAELAAAGFKTTDVMAAMPGVLNLAASGQMSVAQASETAVNVMGGFGIKANEVGHAVDVMAKAAASGSLGVSDLGLSFKYIGPVATAAGISFEESAAAVTLLSNAGIKGEQAGTTLRQAISRLIDPPKAAAEAFERLGITTTDTSGKMRPFGDILEDLRAKGATTKDVFAIFGDTAASGMQALLNTGAPALRAMTVELQNSDGAAAKMAGTLNSGMGGAIERMKGSVETAGIALGNVLAPHIITVAGLIEGAANQLADFGQWFNTLPEPIQTTGIAMAALAAAIGPVLLIGGQLAGAIVSINAAIGVATPLIATFTSTVGASALALAPWVAAIGVATVALYKLWEAWDGWNKAKRDLEDAETRGADALNKLENRLRDNGYAVDDLRKQYHDGKLTLTQYQQALSKMAVELGKKQKVTESATSATGKSAKAEKDFNSILAQVNATVGKQSAALRATGSAMVETANSTTTLHRRSEILYEMARQLEQQHQRNVRELVQWKLAHENAANAMPRMITATQELSDTIQRMSSKMADARQVFGDYSADLKAALETPAPAAESARTRTGRALDGIGNDIDGLTGRARGAWDRFNVDLSGSLGRAATIWDDWTGGVGRAMDDFKRSISEGLWDGDLSFGAKGIESLKNLGKAFTESFIGVATDSIGDFLKGTMQDLIGGKGFGGLIDRVKDLGKTISDVFGAGSTAAGIATGGAGTAGGAGGAGGIPGTSGGGAAASGAQGVMGAVNMVTGIVSAVGDVITAIYSIRQEGTLNAIEHNTRYAMMFLGERSDQGILGQMFRIADTLEFGALVKAMERSRDVLSDYVPAMADLMTDLNTRLQFAVQRLDQIGHNALYGSNEDATQSALLREIAMNAKQRQPVNVNITVSGAGNPQDVANKIASTLRTQLAY